MKPVVNHDFSRIPKTDIRVSRFDRSFDVNTTFDCGKLIPILCDEILPGDTIELSPEIFARLSTPIVPLLDNLFMDVHVFFCPSRLTWVNFTKMMGERVNPRDSIDYVTPMIKCRTNGTGFKVESLADYFGIPINVPDIRVSQLPFRAYAKIWDDWYRAEQIQDSIIQTSDMLGDEWITELDDGSAQLGGGSSTYNWNTILPRGKRFDYFTSCLPSPQLGEGASIPLGDFAPVRFEGSGGETSEFASSSVNGSSSYSGVLKTKKDGNTANLGDGQLVADLSSAAPVSINSLRQAIQIQALLEADSRSGGCRYVEILAQHFRTICPDASLQRSEYIGGCTSRVEFKQVAQTSATDATTPQGNLAAFAYSSLGGKKITKSFTEHGYLIALVSVRGDLKYQQGIPRMFSRTDRFSYYWPLLAHLGEQAVLNKEIFAQGNKVINDQGLRIDDQPFGYQERYAEYKYKPSLITGKMRSTAEGSLDFWHLAQKFENLPTLSPEFIEEKPPLERVLAVRDEPQFICNGYMHYIHTRPLPLHSTPASFNVG